MPQLRATAFAKHQHPGVTIGYSAVGSSAGIAASGARQVDFGASDVPMNASEQAAAKGGPVTQVPVDLGGEGVVYNLRLPAAPDRSGARGDLPRPDHPLERSGPHRAEPGPVLPPAAINVVHRSDGSGTTYIFSFSNYLSNVDPAWASKVGTGKTLNWPAGEGDEGNGGVATAVHRTPLAVGYVEQSYSQGLLVPAFTCTRQAAPICDRPALVRPGQRLGHSPEKWPGQLRSDSHQLIGSVTKLSAGIDNIIEELGSAA